MTEINNLITSATLAEMLPIGMLANGGVIALAMSEVANRKRELPEWEAFHYEKISESEFEITGGIAVMVAGVKKWPGAHDSLIIHVSEILDELKQSGVIEPQGMASGLVFPSMNSESTKIGSATAPYLQIVFSLPEDEIGRQHILKAFHLGADFFGAKVQTCSLLDRFT